MPYDGDVKKVLTGHDGFDSAFIQDDYPYGRQLRCKRAAWVETATKGAKKGEQRFVTRTTNPRRAIETWNKPKPSIYSSIIMLYLDDKEHIHAAHLSFWNEAEKIAAFVETFGEYLTDAQKKTIEGLTVVAH